MNLKHHLTPLPQKPYCMTGTIGHWMISLNVVSGTNPLKTQNTYTEWKRNGMIKTISLLMVIISLYFILDPEDLTTKEEEKHYTKECV